MNELSVFTKNKIERRVARGAARLDQTTPEWYQRVRTSNINLGSETDCILGQIYGSYRTGLYRIRIGGMFAATQHGFMVWTHKRALYAAMLWTAEVNERKYYQRTRRQEIERKRLAALNTEYAILLKESSRA